MIWQEERVTTAALTLAFVHLRVVHKELAVNQAELLRLNEEAAAAGARILINPELALSGYSFRHREDLRPLALTPAAEFLQALRELAARRRVFLCCGWAEREPATDIFYNSATVFGPAGEIVCHYRKVNAESRWSCPGPARQENVFVTPWGKAGVLICSDSYYSLLVRATVLRGARLLLVPANWPPLGLDPRELWRLRALENGIYLAACNRTGQEATLSFLEAPSCCYGPEGQVLLEASSPESRIFLVELPLSEGRLPDRLCGAILARRQVEHYGNIYLDLRLSDHLTDHYQLPSPGFLLVAALTGPLGPQPVPAPLASLPATCPTAGAILAVLPQDSGGVTELATLAASRRLALLLHLSEPPGVLWVTPAGPQVLPWPAATPYLSLDYGPARLAVCRPEALQQPELAVHLAKTGHDLAVVSTGALSTTAHEILKIRCLDQLAVVVAATTGAYICVPPAGHQRWQETQADAGGLCRLLLDTSLLRRKRFQDRVDYGLLLRRPPAEV